MTVDFPDQFQKTRFKKKSCYNFNMLSINYFILLLYSDYYINNTTQRNKRSIPKELNFVEFTRGWI